MSTNIPAQHSNNDGLSPLQRAALVIKDLKEKLATERSYSNEPIAIIGMACKFPGANNIDEYWDLLKHGINAVTEAPTDRWDLETWYDPNPAAEGKISTRFGGFIEKVEAFDAPFFGIPVNEAKRMDPGQRIMLQQVWHALEHAGIPPLSLRGSDTGFFVGMSQNDYGNMQINGNVNDISAYSGTGNGYCFASGRISYQFGFHGPTLTSDTACSSSLVALHQAVQALRQGDSNICIASGVQLNLTPPMQVFFSRTQSFSPDGKCYTFDHRANGFILGEGIGVVVLMKLKDAIAQNKTIHAIIRNSGVNHGGAASGLTIPNETAQERLIKSTLQRSGIDPKTIDYIETHGTGTNLGDPIEVGALKSVFGSRNSEHPLYLGSVKTNIGHLNAAAGMAGLIKTVLMLKNKTIVRNLHFEKPNPKIPWDDFNVKIPVENTYWPTDNENPRRAGVSSFGLSGTNGHVILEEHTPNVQSTSEVTELNSNSNYTFTFSARDDSALNKIISAQLRFLESNRDTVNTVHYSYTLNECRSALEHRIWVEASSIDDLILVLKSIQKDEHGVNWSKSVVTRRDSRKKIEATENTINNLREWYLNGGNIIWKSFYKHEDQVVVDIPKYPFDETRYWLDRKDGSCEISNPDPLDKTTQTQELEAIQENHSPENLPVDPHPTLSIARLMEMQLQHATDALNKVTTKQLESLRIHGIRVSQTDPSTLSQVHHTTVNGKSELHMITDDALNPSDSKAVIDPKNHHHSDSSQSCGDWSIFLKVLDNDLSDSAAKDTLLKEFEGSVSPKSEPSNLLNGSKVAAFAYRDKEDAIRLLTDEKSKRILISEVPKDDTSLIFMFPGVGDHYVNMGKGLYESDSNFRKDIDYCLGIAGKFLNEHDLKSVMYPESTASNGSEASPKFDFKAMLGRDTKADPLQSKMNETRYSQTLVFILEYALGRLWIRKGFKPDAMIGYSIGEYSAAVLSGIMDIESALELVCKRALLIEQLPSGSMLAVPLNEAETLHWISGSNMHIAINSTPTQTVVAGKQKEIDDLAEKLTAKEIMCRKIPSTHAFHTPFLAELDSELQDLVKKFDLKAPEIPLISNVTGTWMTPENAKSPEYWSMHTWKTVRFAQGMSELLQVQAFNGSKRRVFLEVGPGISLGSFMLQHPESKQLSFKMNVPSVKSKYEKTPDEQLLLSTMAKLLVSGYRIVNHNQPIIN